MSEMEESDIEAVALKSRKKNGYSHYGPNKGGAGSTLKLLSCVFGIAALFLVIGLMAGYYIGFDEATSTLWRPLASVPMPDAPVDIPEIEPFRPINDHFTAFKRGGVRYGGDYGQNTITNVRASRSLLSDTDTDELCANRRCCHPTNGVSEEEGQKCYDLTRSECCDMLARDICDWNCEEDVPNVRKDHVGVFSEDPVAEEDVVDSGNPRSVSDLQRRDGVVSDDECGDLYESLIDDETAEYEMMHFGEIQSEALSGVEDEDEERRRMHITGSDSREAMNSKAYPQNQIGIISYLSSEGRYICSGVKVSKRHILTNAHCCHSGGPGGDWYSEWRWVPGALSQSDISPNNMHSASYATILRGWLWWEKNWDYDICWVTLHNSYNGWMGFGYNNGITSSWKFNFWGYPGDKAEGSLIKWGHDDCKPDTVWINQFHYFCDAYKGMSGSGLWLSSNNVVYCVHSYASGSFLRYNGCARITSDKFNTMVDSMKALGGW